MAWGAPAHADPALVAVLPMTSTSRSLQLYETATAAALAKGLASPDRTLQLLRSAKAVPAQAAVIVDGRIIEKADDHLQLEVRIRDAGTGRNLGAAASRVGRATDLDQLVGELAGKLDPLLRHALAPREPYRLPTTIVQGERQPAPPSATVSAAPQLLIVPASGQAAKGVVEVRRPATAGAVQLAQRLALRFQVRSEIQEGAGLLVVANALRQAGAPYALMLHLKKVDFSYSGVLSARGTVRVLVVDAAGRAVIDKTVETGTVVGNRGDRHRALVYLVTEQALDMVSPQLRKLRFGDSRSSS